MDAVFLSCDWGTSSFRLRRVEVDPFRVSADLRSEAGVRAVRDRVERERLDPGGAFRAVLREAIEDLLRGAGTGAPPGMVLVSGMASSSIGWKELPYAAAPFALDLSQAEWEELEPLQAAGLQLRVILISGLRTEDDVLRGEETEAAGILADASRAPLCRDTLLILPGTHSKHVRVEDGAITGFRTYMTGEVFSVLSSSSILRHSVRAGAPLDEDAFRRGVLAVERHGLPGTLFSVRTNQLLHHIEPGPNASYLSGLLVAAEVIDAIGGVPPAAAVVLCAGPALSRSYTAAFDALGLSSRLTLIPPAEVEEAAARGHAVFLRRWRGGGAP